MLVFDHDEEVWRARYMKRGRENGAATYSREIVAHQLPIWERQLKAYGIGSDDVVLSTCPLLSQVRNVPKNKIVVQYLHTYQYDNPTGDAKSVADSLVSSRSVVFVSAYKALCSQLQRRGMPAIFVPMTIDAQTVQLSKAKKRQHKKRVVYFGNVTNAKESVYQRVVSEFRKRAWQVDTISSGFVNGSVPVTQQEAWKKMSQYEYGIGVGRCALEMMALGLKVMVAGAEFGGLVVNDRDFQAQTETNFNGRVVTFNRDIRACIDCFDESISGVTNDINMLAPTIEDTISSYLKSLNV